jgi:hypothetical protein
MTSRYILDAMERARLPIMVTTDPIGWVVSEMLLPPPDDLYAIQFIGPSRTDAVAAYFALVETLSPNPETSLPVSGLDRSSRSSSPWGTI